MDDLFGRSAHPQPEEMPSSKSNAEKTFQRPNSLVTRAEVSKSMYDAEAQSGQENSTRIQTMCSWFGQFGSEFVGAVQEELTVKQILIDKLGRKLKIEELDNGYLRTQSKVDKAEIHRLRTTLDELRSQIKVSEKRQEIAKKLLNKIVREDDGQAGTTRDQSKSISVRSARSRREKPIRPHTKSPNVRTQVTPAHQLKTVATTTPIAAQKATATPAKPAEAEKCTIDHAAHKLCCPANMVCLSDVRSSDVYRPFPRLNMYLLNSELNKVSSGTTLVECSRTTTSSLTVKVQSEFSGSATKDEKGFWRDKNHRKSKCCAKWLSCFFIDEENRQKFK